MRTGPCRRCGKPVVFGALTISGSCVPLDPIPPVYRVVSDTDDGIITVTWVERVKDSYVSHFAICSKASEFSKGRKATP